MKKTLLAVALVLPVCAAHAVENLSWTQANVAYAVYSEDDFDNFTGLSAGGTKLLDDNVFFTGQFESTSQVIDNIDLGLFRVSLGLGYRHAISETTDFFGKVTYENYTTSASKTSSGVTTKVSIDYSGHAIEGGIRSLVTPKVELGASLSSLTIEGDSDTGLNLQATYHLNDVHSIGWSTSRFDGYSFTHLKWAYSFR
jgi:hypothetical protein